MNKEETAQILAILKAAFPNSFKNMTAGDARATVNVWQMNFSDIPADVVLIAVYKTISVSEFPPTVAAIRNKFRSIYIESYSALNDSDITPDMRAKYARICEILQPYYMTRNCPEITLFQIMDNLPLKTHGGQIGANAGEIQASENNKGGNV